MNATAASVVSNKGGELCVVRSDERALLLAPGPGPALLLHDRPPGPFATAQKTTFLDGDDGGDHVSNGGTCSMLVDGEKRNVISLLCLGNRPNTKPAASLVCLGFHQASYRRPGWVGQAGAGPT